jgi:hypothetical protein
MTLRQMAGLTLRFIIGAAPGFSGNARGQDVLPSEYQMKAAYLYNFAKFVEWPPTALPADAPLVIGILGNDPFDHFLDDTIHGKKIGNHPLVSVHIQTPAETKGCQIVFINGAEKKHWPEISNALKDKAVLTVSENWDQFTKEGGMIYLFIEDQHVCFDINDEAARRAGLKISSKLLLLRKKPSS